MVCFGSVRMPNRTLRPKVPNRAQHSRCRVARMDVIADSESMQKVWLGWVGSFGVCSGICGSIVMLRSGFVVLPARKPGRILYISYTTTYPEEQNPAPKLCIHCESTIKSVRATWPRIIWIGAHGSVFWPNRTEPKFEFSIKFRPKIKLGSWSVTRAEWRGHSTTGGEILFSFEYRMSVIY